jgi:hypothetical protein
MKSIHATKEPVRSPEDVRKRIALLDGETLDDFLSLYDAMNRYGVNRTTFRQAVIEGRLQALRVGGQSRQIMYLRRRDIIDYISLPMSKMQQRRPVPWRVQDQVPDK